MPVAPIDGVCVIPYEDGTKSNGMEHTTDGSTREPDDLPPNKSRRFYEEILRLRAFHEFRCAGQVIGVVYFLGGEFLELAGSRSTSANGFSKLWLQVRDVHSEEQRLRALGQSIRKSASRKPWGLIELSLGDPDGHEILLVEVPEDHFLRQTL